MIDLHDIRYLRIGTPNLENAIDFATKIVGLQLVRRVGKAAYFRSDVVDVRGDTRDHTLVYFEGDSADHTVGFELNDPYAFDAVATELEALGHPVHVLTADECDLRRAKRVMTFRDPSGNRIEIAARPYHSGERFFPGRDAGVTSFSHIGLNSTDPVRDEAFWTRVMNARVSDWIGDAPLLRINTIHHSLALFPAKVPGIQHVNHQVENIDDLMKSYYFLKERNIKIVFGPGRHPLSTACMLYFEGPDKLVYEYSVDVKHIYPQDEASYRPRQFPFEQFAFCMWGAVPDIPQFQKKDKAPEATT